eukprot:GHVS01073145.1.p1 GENE.GHVS01073145.1~~GHVS01073145.1.p1  ORF type:complete len:206 (+),score=40.38 GHVS01073145.1:151-768(+)
MRAALLLSSREVLRPSTLGPLYPKASLSTRSTRAPLPTPLFSQLPPPHPCSLSCTSIAKAFTPSRRSLHNGHDHATEEQDLEGRVLRELKALCCRYLNQMDPATMPSSSAVVEGEQLGESAIDAKQGILEDLLMTGSRRWDCLDTVEFLLDVENLFGITFPDEVADELKSIEEIKNFVIKSLQAQKAASSTDNTAPSESSSAPSA